MRRREFALGFGAAVATPMLADRRAKPARLGYIWIGAKGSEHSTLDGLRRGLRELDCTEGVDFVIVDRYADSEGNRLAGLVAELVRLNVDLILSPGNQVTRAAMQGTSTIPILATAPDLVASGFVASLAHPGGNVTGISLTAGAALAQKWLELVKEIRPNVTEVAVLSNSGSTYVERLREAASALGMRMRDFVAGDADEIDRALLAIASAKPGALIVESDPMLVSNRGKIVAFAARNRLPTVYGNPDYMPDGGLIAYATSIREVWRRLATYVHRVLNGARPSDLPVEQPTRFELIINLKTAKTLDLTIPPSLLTRADEVIE